MCRVLAFYQQAFRLTSLYKTTEQNPSLYSVKPSVYKLRLIRTVSSEFGQRTLLARMVKNIVNKCLCNFWGVIKHFSSSEDFKLHHCKKHCCTQLCHVVLDTASVLNRVALSGSAIWRTYSNLCHIRNEIHNGRPMSSLIISADSPFNFC